MTKAVLAPGQTLPNADPVLATQAPTEAMRCLRFQPAIEPRRIATPILRLISYKVQKRVSDPLTANRFIDDRSAASLLTANDQTRVGACSTASAHTMRFTMPAAPFPVRCRFA